MVLLQSESGIFSEYLDNITISDISLAEEKLPSDATEVFCTVGDFNGDAYPDIMVTHVSVSDLDAMGINSVSGDD